MSVSSPVFIFDAFGTLFDVHAVAREHASALGHQATRLSELWRSKQLEYTWIHARLDRRGDLVVPPFREHTRASLLYALSACELDESLAPGLLESYQRMPAFPEAGQSLGRLKGTGAKLAILSNADIDMLEDLIANAGFESLFDHLISARVAGSFKPDPSVYALGTEVYGRPAGDLLFVSSNRWDIAGAKAFGYRTIWVNRAGAPDEYAWLEPERVVSDLTGLVGSASSETLK